MAKSYSKQSPQITEILSIFYNLDQKYRYIRMHSCFSSVGGDDLLDQYRSDVSRINYALKRLDIDQSYIITQSFRYNGSFSNSWWKGIYTKSSFYRKRKQAIDKFLKEYHQTC